MENTEDSHHQMEKIWGNSDITRRKLVREAAKRTDVTSISHILHMSGLWGRVARRKPFFYKEKHPSPAKFCKNTLEVSHSMWEYVL